MGVFGGSVYWGGLAIFGSVMDSWKLSLRSPWQDWGSSEWKCRHPVVLRKFLRASLRDFSEIPQRGPQKSLTKPKTFLTECFIRGHQIANITWTKRLGFCHSPADIGASACARACGSVQECAWTCPGVHTKIDIVTEWQGDRVTGRLTIAGWRTWSALCPVQASLQPITDRGQ